MSIPNGLSPPRVHVYERLIDVKAARRRQGIPVPHAIVISDLDKDYDDLAAMTVLRELHRMGLLRLVGYVANLVPAAGRAKFARGALDSMGLQNVPVAVGTQGVNEVTSHRVHDYELQAKFMADFTIQETGKQLMTRLCRQARQSGRQLTIVCLSSLRDIWAFANEQPALFRQTIRRVCLQGGVAPEQINGLQPDPSAANNKYDFNSAREFIKFVDTKTPALTFSMTKIAAFATPTTAHLFQELAESGTPVGQHLHQVQTKQDLQFYRNAYYPETRYQPHMDRDWFLKNKTCWYDTMGRDAQPPTPDEVPGIMPYVTKLVLYDALPALAAAGVDVLDALGVLENVQIKRHTIVGEPGESGLADEGRPMANALEALMVGCQLAVAQGLPSEPEDDG